MKHLHRIAAYWFAASACIHGLTFVGVNPQRGLPVIGIVHITAGVMFVIAVVAMCVAVARVGKDGFIDLTTRDAPVWLGCLAVLVPIYTVINVLAMVAWLPGSPDISSGLQVLHNRGQIMRFLTDAEFNYYQALEVRLFSGHWMTFFIIASLVCHGAAGVLSSDVDKREPAPAQGTVAT